MRKTALILILVIFNLAFGQDKYVGIYKDHFSESIELKTDSTFIHDYRLDLASSWTTGKWKVENDTIYLTTEFVMDTLQIRDSENKVIRDSMVLSADRNVDRIDSIEFAISSFSSGGQNRKKPPEKLFWKGEKLYKINNDGKLDFRKLKAFSSDNKYFTYFKKITD